ncbi:hypothetical protein L195_g035526 [Trifolium pratense]|uniref:Uncharacterized protein n=1 Tax=Trifolium pratense TaxID=57577 RepID=A0A2K3LLX7_TRIPR|nr:hypothetical protein L195_g035526 [Trifolium pratense]
MQTIVIGIFGLKKLPVASGLTLPLPIVTLLFNEYCQKRFFPIFQAFPAEVLSVDVASMSLGAPCCSFWCSPDSPTSGIRVMCLIKKDRQDQNDPNMSEFYDKLNKAYNDPALMPIKYSGRFSSRRSPLLGSSEPKTMSRESSSEDMIV